MAMGKCISSALTSELQRLNLDDFCLPPEIAQELEITPTPVAGEKSRLPVSAAATPPKSETELAGASGTYSKKRRNRRQRRRRTLDENKPEKSSEHPDEDETGKIDGACALPPECSSRVSGVDVAVEMLTSEASMESLRDRQQSPLSSRNVVAGRKLPTPPPPPSPPPPPAQNAEVAKKAGSRRRRGGKRKKQRSPDPVSKSADKENDKFGIAAMAAAGLGAEAKTDDEEQEDDDDDVVNVDDYSSSSGAGARGGRNFLWRNVTKNGWIKKCILVDGLIENGRPKPGDTVLVKSQGKLKDGTIIDDYPTLVFNVGEHEVVEGLDLAVQSMYKNELSILSVKPEMAYGQLGRKGDIPAGARITYLFGLLHFEKQKEISQLTWAQRRKTGQSRMRLANWWYQRKEYPVAVKCYKKALEYYNNIPTNQECSTPEEYKELLQLMEERLRVMRQVANIFKRIANMIQSGQISP